MAILRWQHTRPGWNFWLRWILGTIGGLILLLLLSVPINAIVFFFTGGPEAGSPPPLTAALFVSLGWVVAGAAFGLGQWWALRSELAGSGWWVVATAAGYPLGGLLQQAFPGIDNPALRSFSMALSFGLAIGIAQWLFLRGRVRRAGWWVLISVAGWLLAVVATGAAYLSGLYVEPFDMLSAFLFPAGVSGAGLVWLLRYKF